ncbi:uncharacterized protein PAC_09577 [Phialocephala subalpina]|uniref:Uncharacterized protein n=1 Tax=Phialocephala subalpina TaxID=576137 RepID=A0A1L7X3T6_9HELO|nr:uncharacterized protein PAC_09577 [Phialocephala subalpina]
MVRLDEKTIPPPQYQKVIGPTANTVSVASPLSSSSQSSPRKTTVLNKLGLWNCIIVLVGSLWTGNEHNKFWRWLVKSGYMRRTVTLSSAVLRTALTFQASIYTSMIAGSLMELSNGFNLQHSASISIRRYHGGMPVLLLHSGIFDRRTWYLLTITILLSSTTIASYFLSTGLVSDLGIAPIIGDPIASTIETCNAEVFDTDYSIDSQKSIVLQAYEPDFSIYSPSTYPTFGEYSEPAPNIQGVDDTWRIMRAIPPVSSATTRENLSNYTGKGTLNSHVVLSFMHDSCADYEAVVYRCVGPVLRNLTLVQGAIGPTFGGNPPYIRGMVSIGDSIPSGLNFYNSSVWTEFDLTSSPTNFISFTCSLTKLMNGFINNEHPISLCVAGNFFENETIDGGGSDGTTRAPILGLQATTFLHDGLLMDPLSYILVNYTSNVPSDKGMQLYKNWTDISSSDSSWTTMQNINNFTSTLESISLSYCFTNFGSLDTNITVTSSTNRTEPVLRSVSSSTNLDVNDVLKQLNATGINSTLEERGVLALNYSDWSALVMDFGLFGIVFNGSITQMLGGTYGLGMQNTLNFFHPQQTSWALCTYCAIGSTSKGDTNTTGISRALSSIFQSSVQQSGSTATALNAVLTVMNMVQYSTRLQRADITGESHITLIEQQLRPVGRTGLITVTAALIAHLLIVAAISIIFLSLTRFSFIGESWHTIAQLQYRDVIPVLQASNLMRDDELEVWLQERNVCEEKMTLVGQDEHTGAHIARQV